MHIGRIMKMHCKKLLTCMKITPYLSFQTNSIIPNTLVEFIPFDTHNLNLTNHSAEYLQHLALNLCLDPESDEQD